MLAMSADHVAWAMLDSQTYLAESLHFVGRLVMPLMCYFLAVGFGHTRDKMAYAKRLLVFALISQIPFVWFGVGIENHQAFFANFWHGNVLFTLFFSLVALMIYESKMALWQKMMGIICLYPICQLSDYGFAMVVLTVFFYYCHTHAIKKSLMAITYVALLPVVYVLIYGFAQTAGLGFMHYGMVLSMLLILAYDGQKGSSFGGRYLFYVFYPTHLMAIAIIAHLVK